MSSAASEYRDPSHATEAIKIAIEQKRKELDDCIKKCNLLRRELQALKDTCVEGGLCEWEAKDARQSHFTSECRKCHRLQYESRGGRRKSRRKSRGKSRRRRKSKKRQTKRRRRK